MILTKFPMEVVDHTYNLEVEPYEKIIVSFDPDGVNATRDGEKIGFVIQAVSLGNGRMALVLKIGKNLYQNKSSKFFSQQVDMLGALFILEDNNDADILEFPDKLLKLVKVREHLG
jgi:hypothetical protein